MAANGISTASSRLRKALLGGVSALPLACAVLAPHAAAAQTCAPDIVNTVSGPITLSGDCTIASTGVVSGGDTAITNPAGSIASLTNSGSIAGVLNAGSISALNNESGGLISAFAPINNIASGSIGTLTNNGEISGFFGIGNAGSIGALANTGRISGAPVGIINGASSSQVVTSSIGTLTNSGTIIAGSDGIFNTGTIGTLSNSGLIEATSSSGTNVAGVDNNGSMGTLTNNADGTILGGQSGIANFGNIQSLTNNGFVGGMNSSGIQNKGFIGALTNNALIEGGSSGIDNYGGTIGTLTNNGLIAGDSVAGIENANYNGTIGSIGTLINSTGVIGGNRYGIYNNNGTIGTLENAGLITGGSTGVLNSGMIGTLTNSGTISGNSRAIYNDGTIDALTNAGAIIGYYSGIDNYGSIGALTNSGTISANNYEAIYNDGTIDALNNLAGGVIGSNSTAIYNDGTIGALTNSGTISSTDSRAIENDGTIGTLDNLAGGVISSTGSSAIYNTGTIGTLTNNGTIVSSDSHGIYNSGTIDALTNTGVIVGGRSGIENYGSIGALANSGAIGSADDYGVYNNGTIDALTNSGVITGHYSGIENGGTISTLANSGTISGNSGIYNYDEIDALSNSGVINGNSYAGIYNDGTIGTLANSGVIRGGSSGIYNDDTIGALTNSGAIIGSSDGIFNSNTIGSLDNQAGGVIDGNSNAGVYNEYSIGTLTNSGTIVGSKEGIYNNGGSSSGYGGGTIGTLTNNGVIQGASVGINNAAGSSINGPGGTIGTLTNNGVISGGKTGIYNAGTIGALVNEAGGTIIGGGSVSTANNGGASGVISALNSGSSAVGTAGTIGTLTNNAMIVQNSQIGGTTNGVSGAIYSTGGGLGAVSNSGLISGNINVLDQNLAITGGSGSVFGTLSGGTIGLTPGDKLAFASGNQVLADDVNVGSAGMVTNDGTLQIGTPSALATVNLTGNFVQNADGTLIVPITPSQSSELNVSGNATLGGALIYDFAPGTYTPSHAAPGTYAAISRTYQVLTASSITGTFASVTTENLPKGAATQTVYQTDPGVQLTFTSPAVVVSPANDTIFSAQTEALAENTQTDMGLLLDKAAVGGTSDDAACAAAAQTAPGSTSQNGMGATARLAGTLGNAFCGAGGWIEATGSLMNASHSNGAPGYNADGGGFLAGIDRVIGAAETRLGFALGYDQTRLTDGSGTGSMGVVRVALYGAQPVGPVTLSGVISYGNASNNTSRATGFANVSEHYSANIYSGGAQASTNVELGPIALVPAAGIRVAGLGGASFVENANGAAAAFAVSGTTANYNSVQPFATISLSHQFVTGSNISIATNAKIGYEYQAGSENVITLLTSADGTQFHASGNKLDPNDALVALGVAAGKNNWSVFANYGARVSGNWTAQTAEIGLQVKF